MPQFLLSVWHDAEVVYDPSVPPTDEMQAMFDRVGEFNAALEAGGAWVFAGGLEPPSTATVLIAVSDGDGVERTEGPHSSAERHMGGFWVIDTPDRASAIDWARRGAAACGQPVEVRAFHG